MDPSPYFDIEGYLEMVDSGLREIRARHQLMAGKQLLGLISEALTLAGRFQALATLLIGEAEHAGTTQEAHGTDARTWLADTQLLTRTQAGALVHQANDLDRFTQLRDAYLAGGASPAQAQAVTRVLRKLPPEHHRFRLGKDERSCKDHCWRSVLLD